MAASKPAAEPVEGEAHVSNDNAASDNAIVAADAEENAAAAKMPVRSWNWADDADASSGMWCGQAPTTLTNNPIAKSIGDLGYFLGIDHEFKNV